MTSDQPNPSDLRQWINVLSAQMQEKRVDPVLVLRTCQLVAMAMADKETPLPRDVFADGIDDAFARLTLSAMCMTMLQLVGGQLAGPVTYPAPK